MRVRGVLFDFDGTLADTIELILAAFRHTFKVCLHRELPREAIIRTFGLTLAEAMAEYAPSPAMLEEMRSVYRDFNHRHHDAMIRPIEGAAATLALLRDRGIKMAVVTSKKEPMARRGLRCCGLEEYIATVVGCEAVRHAKPHSEPMLTAAALLRLAPQDCLCVGDSPYDLQSGRGAGCATAAVRYTYYDWPALLAEARPDYTIRKITDLPELIEKINHAEEAGRNA